MFVFEPYLKRNNTIIKTAVWVIGISFLKFWHCFENEMRKKDILACNWRKGNDVAPIKKNKCTTVLFEVSWTANYLIACTSKDECKIKISLKARNLLLIKQQGTNVCVRNILIRMFFLCFSWPLSCSCSSFEDFIQSTFFKGIVLIECHWNVRLFLLDR